MIIFTRHSIERLKQRNIPKQIIMEIEPKKFMKNTIEDEYGNLVLHKKFKEKLLRIFYRIDDDGNIIIITAYLTSKLDKYGN